MKIAALVLAVALLVCPTLRAQSVPRPSPALVEHVNNSVAELFVEDISGSMHMTCSATAFSKVTLPGTPTTYKYRFVSAAHCVGGDNDSQQRQQKFFVSADARGEKTFTAAKLIEAGDKSKGDDFSLFEVTTAENYDFIPMGDEHKLALGDPIISVADPYGLGKQYFQGYVSDLSLDRPPVDSQVVMWTDLMLIQIGGGPGSSGSSVVSVDQKAIVGFLVGGTYDIGKLCVPVSKFRNFVEAVDSGKYKKEHKGSENE